MLLKASPIGFEPTISCVTGRRALRCSTRTNCMQVAQAGFEPAASLRPTFGRCPSQSGLPIAYRAICVVSAQSRSRTCKHSATHAERRCPSRVGLPVGVSRRRCLSRPGGTRTPDRLLVREQPSPLGHRTILLSGPTGNHTRISGMRHQPLPVGR